MIKMEAIIQAVNTTMIIFTLDRKIIQIFLIKPFDLKIKPFDLKMKPFDLKIKPLDLKIKPLIIIHLIKVKKIQEKKINMENIKMENIKIENMMVKLKNITNGIKINMNNQII